MASEPALNFGPQWLRDSFQDSNSSKSHPLDMDHAGGGGVGGGSGGVGAGNGVSRFGTANLGSKLATMKLAEYRYGKEEMLALFDTSFDPDETGHDRNPPEGFLKQFAHLWIARAQTPLNLQGPMSEEEQRIWQRGANSEASSRIYRKEDPGGSARGGSLGRGRGMRGTGRGSGAFERHRSVNEEEEREILGGTGGRGGQGGSRGRAGWFDRSISTPGADDLNGGVSPRKGYTRAPYDDWRKPTGDGRGEDEENGGWRGQSGGNRRWNTSTGGWRTRDEASEFRRFGERESRDFVNGGPVNSRWKEPNEGYRSSRGGMRGHHSFGNRGERGGYRHDSSDLPEWASEDPDMEKGGTFDSAGKFQASSKGYSREREENDDEQWDDENQGLEKSSPDKDGLRDNQDDLLVDEEEVDPDDLTPGEKEMLTKKKTESMNEDPQRSKEMGHSQLQHQEQPQVPSDDIPHLDAGNFVSQLLDDDEENLHPHQQQAAFLPSKTVPNQRETFISDDNNQQLQQQQQCREQQHHQPSRSPKPALQYKWIYLDPQRNIQGPFSDDDMLDWYQAGYFPRDLMLRRTCDQKFIPLNEMVALYERIPFISDSTPPPPPIQDAAPPEEPQHEPVLQIPPELLNAHPLMLQQRLQQLHQLGQHNTHEFNVLRIALEQLIQKEQQQHKEHRLQQQSEQQRNEQELHQQQLQHQQKQQQEEEEREKAFLAALEQQRFIQQQHQQQQQLQQQLADRHQKHEPHQSPENYDAIQSLLTQLHQDGIQGQLSNMNDDHQHSPSPRNDQGILDMAAHRNQNQIQHHHSSGGIWDMNHLTNQEPNMTSDVQPNTRWTDTTQTLQPSPSPPAINFNSSGVTQQHEEVLEFDDGEENFMQPKSNEKRDKKNRKAEERKRQKEAKKIAEEMAEKQKYIPGMHPPEQARQQHFDDTVDQQREALLRLQQEQQSLLMREEAERMKQEHEGQMQQKQKQQQQHHHHHQQQIKLAPWAKNVEDQNNQAFERSIIDSGLSLTEIQRLEEENERKSRMEREMKEREERVIRARKEAEEREKKNSRNWAAVGVAGTSSSSGQVRSLAEIQAEETKLERQRQEQERSDRLERQKTMNLAQASVWGNASSNLTWASKANNSHSVITHQSEQQQSQQRNNGGFWDEQPQQTPFQQQQQQKGHHNQNNQQGKKKKQKVKEEEKVSAIFKEGKAPKNEFEAWCTKALSELDIELDIPTFIAFLQDVESPYEVHDYVKSYIGDSKTAKNFGKEFLERRSKYKNALKNSNKRYEDDLLTPAQAINPNEPVEDGGNFGAKGGGYQQSGRGKKKGKKEKNKGMDANHLLGFSVTSGSRVNAGELDLPQ